jgi:hypothetical protein
MSRAGCPRAMRRRRRTFSTILERSRVNYARLEGGL